MVGRTTHIIYVASSFVSIMLPCCEPSDKPFYLSKPQFYSLYNGSNININDSFKDPPKQSMWEYLLILKGRYALLKKENRKRSKAEKLKSKHEDLALWWDRKAKGINKFLILGHNVINENTANVHILLRKHEGETCNIRWSAQEATQRDDDWLSFVLTDSWRGQESWKLDFRDIQVTHPYSISQGCQIWSRAGEK